MFGIVFIIITYYSDIVDKSNSLNLEIYKIALDTLVPTTITYILAESIHNMILLYEKKNGNYLWSIITFLCVTLYEMLYLIYRIANSFCWMNIITIATILLLILNALSYRDSFYATHRNHGLI